MTKEVEMIRKMFNESNYKAYGLKEKDIETLEEMKEMTEKDNDLFYVLVGLATKRITGNDSMKNIRSKMIEIKKEMNL